MAGVKPTVAAKAGVRPAAVAAAPRPAIAPVIGSS